MASLDVPPYHSCERSLRGHCAGLKPILVLSSKRRALALFGLVVDVENDSGEQDETFDHLLIINTNTHD